MTKYSAVFTLLATLVACGSEEEAFLARCEARLTCTGDGMEYSPAWQVEIRREGDSCVAPGLFADDHAALDPDGKVRNSDNIDVSWSYSDGVLRLDSAEVHLSCRDPRCVVDADLDCDRVRQCGDRCADKEDDCLYDCNGDHLCRSDCYTGASYCFGGCADKLQKCADLKKAPAYC